MMRQSWAALMAASLMLAGCTGITDPALCERVEEVAQTRDRLAEASAAGGDAPDPRDGAPDPRDVAALYRTLSVRYEEAADELDDNRAMQSTRELASLYDQGAAVLDDLDHLDPEATEQRWSETEVHQALRNRMERSRGLGFSPAAWNEIQAACNVETDPPASK